MKKNPFKRFPVLILPPGFEGTYIPGDPIPEGAELNTPLPGWIWMLAVSVIALALLGVMQLAEPGPAITADVTLTPAVTATVQDGPGVSLPPTIPGTPGRRIIIKTSTPDPEWYAMLGLPTPTPEHIAR